LDLGEEWGKGDGKGLGLGRKRKRKGRKGRGRKVEGKVEGRRKGKGNRIGEGVCIISFIGDRRPCMYHNKLLYISQATGYLNNC